jgi:hypothetical protein
MDPKKPRETKGKAQRWFLGYSTISSLIQLFVMLVSGTFVTREENDWRFTECANKHGTQISPQETNRVSFSGYFQLSQNLDFTHHPVKA